MSSSTQSRQDAKPPIVSAMTPEPETYPMPAAGWTCFHCGETFTVVGSAQDHFGGTPNALAGCQIKLGEERGLQMELRKAEASRDEWMKRALDGCNSINDVFFLYDSIEGRAIAAEGQLAEGRL